MRGKRGWIRILEATIAVMIVSGVMISVYSDQLVRDDLTVSEYSSSLQNEILDDVSIASDFRLAVLSIVNETPSDPNYVFLEKFVNASVPDSFGYHLRVCNLTEICNMLPHVFIATLDYDVFVEDTIVSADLGNGSNIAVYSPKKIRLFFWEGKPAPKIGILAVDNIVYGTKTNIGGSFYKYPFNVTFAEIGGVNIDIYNKTICLPITGCATVSSFSLLVPAGGLISDDTYFQTDKQGDVTHIYSGLDENNNPVSINFTFITSDFP